ncbi:flagellar hook-basal body protein [Paludibaculum fermentans]|uniref:Flagellar hook basal-body protein n=1 Tax=Paludibaculum fermentans TaxID=1473598 RepID=A0A7S7NQR8_PALFE|nr:flagellar hook basal-body protein [Paludibaculum fermentans]QOY87584.1 flagellar hook basal-body protein [Paludibaculum fermentans]
MDPLTTTAAAGMRSRLETLDLLANNLANVSSPGFKADREAYSLYMAEESLLASEEGGIPQTSAPVIETHHTDYGQGLLTSTGNSTDLALSGTGFFQVDGPNGTLLTRNGRLQVTRDGRLTTMDGYALSTVEPRRIRLNPEAPFSVDPDGTVRQDGAAMGRLKLVNLGSKAQAARREGLYFSLDARGVQGLTEARAEVRQGSLEASNYSASEAAVKLVGVLRQFEALQRASQLGAEMSRRAVEEVARVTA